MGSLIPEQRPDRNGHLVTRWVRTFNAQDKKTPIPTPSLTSQPVNETRPQTLTAPERDQLVADAKSTLTTGVSNQRINVSQLEKMHAAVYFLAEEAPELLQRVVEQSREDNGAQKFLSSIFTNKNIAPSSGVHNYWDGTSTGKTPPRGLGIVRTALVVSSLGAHLGLDQSEMYGLNTAVRSFSFNDQNPDDEHIRAYAAIAYARGTHDSGFDTDTRAVTDSELDYFAQNMDRIESFLPQIAARRSSDPAMVAVMIGNSQPLAEGSL
jgi:hypothetical protein